MRDFFKAKIGQKLHKNLVTGNNFFTEVYQRNYTIEVIGINRNELHVYVTSYDVVPSGYKAGGTDKDFEDVFVNIGKMKTLNEVIKAIIEKVDLHFLIKYKKVWDDLSKAN